LYSEVLGESREIWVHTPTNHQEGKQYPVLYLLDGPGHFYSVVGLIKQLSTTNGNTLMPEMIVVAIANTDRSRDLTPTEVKIDFFTGDSIQYASGGGDRFLEFMEKELIPYVDTNFPTAPYRTFVGHSFGGLSVINALITRSYLFNNYVAIDPSLWWDGSRFMEFADSVLTAGDFSDKRLFVGVANTMDEAMNIATVENDTAKSSAHIRAILKFAKSQEANDNGMQFGWKYYEDDTHGSVPLITEYDALRTFFSWYELKGMNKLFDGTFTAEESLAYLDAHYDNVSQEIGFEILPDEMLINGLGYYFMNENKLEKAAIFFDLNIKNYPESSNVYDSRGDCYLAAGDSTKALAYFKKSLEVGPNDFSQEKIDMLEDSLNQ
jgi:predicted alpha/beta superfamily hydrolase